MADELVRTLRIRTQRKVGALGLLTTALGDMGAIVGEIGTISVGHTYMVREFQISVQNEGHLEQIVESVNRLADSDIVEVVNEVRAVHRGGKIRIRPRMRLEQMSDLLTAYTPGVREIIQLIDDDERQAEAFTAVRRTVAIISDGAGLYGVGRVRSRAMLPVLESKSALLAKNAGLNGLPLVLDVGNEDEFVETVCRLAPSCSAIVLDAIAAPRGLRVMARLTEAVDLPVFDDDSDGPAITVLGALINACRRCGRDLRELNVGQIGLGTAGGSIARLVMKYTGRAVYGEDVHPSTMSRHVAHGGRESSLDEIMSTCDVVVANTGHRDVIRAEQVRPGQIILALSEPAPEIDTYNARLAGAAFAADGKAVNKAVAFAGVLLGALCVNARLINDEMRLAAGVALADSAENADLIPTPLDENVHVRVAAAVAAAAIRTGVARDIPKKEITVDILRAVVEDREQLPLFFDDES